MIDYANNWQVRNEMIWKAITAVNSEQIKDPIKYVNRMTKKYGDIFKTTVGYAYEVKYGFCYAVQIDKIDEKLCEDMGWKTIQNFRGLPTVG
jgi:hypothetical protein